MAIAAHRTERNPDAEISAANPWYVDSQFAIQLGSPVFRAVVEKRWHRFAGAIGEWASETGAVPSRLLDAGCGDGINLSFLSRLVRDRKWNTALVGTDYSPLRLARSGVLEGLSGLVQSSVIALGFEDASFDIIICNQVLEHVSDDHGGLTELHRVLRPGGLLLVGVPNEGSALGTLRNHVLQRSILTSTDHVNMFTERRLRERLCSAGFMVTRIETESFFLPHTVLHAALNRWAPIRRSLDALGRWFPSCAAGLLAVARRPVESPR